MHVKLFNVGAGKPIWIGSNKFNSEFASKLAVDNCPNVYCISNNSAQRARFSLHTFSGKFSDGVRNRCLFTFGNEQSFCINCFTISVEIC